MSDDSYKTAIEALARQTAMSAESAGRIESELLEALARRDVTAAAVPPASSFRWRPWMSVAAAALLIASSLVTWKLNTVTVNTVTTGSGEQVPRESPAVPAHASADHSPAAHVVASTAATRRHGHSTSRPRPLTVVKPSGFVELPGAAALPAFESGAIVRMELPVASLPEYGVDISAGAADRPVEADVLVGQDGRARAIRLVRNSARSVQ